MIRKLVLGFALTLLAVVLVGFVSTGFEMYHTISTREEAMRTFVRLATKDAIVNIQATEEYGLDAREAQKLLNFTDNLERNDYSAYLNALAAGFANSADGNAENLALIQKFLQMNKSNMGNKDAVFRPIQFGMTYVSPELFEASFKCALRDLIKANFASTEDGELAVEQNDAIYINWGSGAIDRYIDVRVSEPKAAPIPRGSENSYLFNSIYGVDKANFQFASLEESLGFADASINFYVYYDIDITVRWKSTMSNQLLTAGFLRNFGIEDNHDGKLFDPNGFLRMDGPDIHYSYRYVLTN